MRLTLHPADLKLAFMQVVKTARMVVQTELVFFLRIALCGYLFTGCLADSLPTAWRTGIATNYGGAQDGKVSQYQKISLPTCYRMPATK